MSDVYKLRPTRLGTSLRNAKKGCQRLVHRTEDGYLFARCSRKWACSSCTGYWSLITTRQPRTWAIVSLNWIIEKEG